MKGILFALIAVLSIMGSIGVASADNSGKNDDKKVWICHIPPGNLANAHAIEVSENAWKAHEKHGDYQISGPNDPSCGRSLEPAPTVVVTPDPTEVVTTPEPTVVVTPIPTETENVTSESTVASVTPDAADVDETPTPSGVPANESVGDSTTQTNAPVVTGFPSTGSGPGEPSFDIPLYVTLGVVALLFALAGLMTRGRG